MKVGLIATTLLSVATLGAATPTPIDVTLPGPQLDKRAGNGANCKVYNDSGQDKYRLETWGPWVNDWGKGFLDNIRGQCKAIVFNWKFDYVGDKGIVSFGITAAARHWCVEDAAWLASNPSGAIWGLSCKRETSGKELAAESDTPAGGESP